MRRATKLLYLAALVAATQTGAAAGAAEKPKEYVCPPGYFGKDCTISVNEPHAKCSESARVIATVKYMAALLAKGDLKTYSDYLADGCTTFDEGTHKLIEGKQAVLDDLKKKLDSIATGGREPLLRLTIEEPYAQVNGDIAVVTFRAIKEVGGSHPDKEEVHATDVFVKHGHKWQKLHFRGEWKRIG